MSDLEFSFVERTDVGLVREANEDNMGNAETPNGHVFTVCDGMGGHVGGATASRIAVQSILEFFSKEVYDNLYIAISRAIEFANEQVYGHAQSNPELKGMGTTCTVLILKGNEVFLGHVGDSRIYLRTEGKLRRISRDHSFVQTLVDQGLISDSQAENHPRKNELLKALGIRPTVEPTVCSAPVKPVVGDVFMLCSDGLNGLVNDPTIDHLITEASSLDQSAESLIETAKSAGGHDNITVQLIQITQSPYTHPAYEDLTPQEHTETGPGFDPQKTMMGAKVDKQPFLRQRKNQVLIGLLGAIVIILIVVFSTRNGEDEAGSSVKGAPPKTDSITAKKSFYTYKEVKENEVLSKIAEENNIPKESIEIKRNGDWLRFDDKGYLDDKLNPGDSLRWKNEIPSDVKNSNGNSESTSTVRESREEQPGSTVQKEDQDQPNNDSEEVESNEQNTENGGSDEAQEDLEGSMVEPEAESGSKSEETDAGNDAEDSGDLN